MAVLGPPMLTQEQAVEVRVLKRQGKSIRAIARELGLSRVTVRRYLRKAGAQRYGPREPRPTKSSALWQRACAASHLDSTTAIFVTGWGGFPAGTVQLAYSSATRAQAQAFRSGSD